MISFPVCNKKVDTNLTLTKNIKPNPPSPQPLEHHPPTYLPTYAVKYSVHKCLCVGMRTNPRYHFHSPRRRFFLASESSQTHSAWGQSMSANGVCCNPSDYRHSGIYRCGVFYQNDIWMKNSRLTSTVCIEDIQTLDYHLTLWTTFQFNISRDEYSPINPNIWLLRSCHRINIVTTWSNSKISPSDPLARTAWLSQLVWDSEASLSFFHRSIHSWSIDSMCTSADSRHANLYPRS